MNDRPNLRSVLAARRGSSEPPHDRLGFTLYDDIDLTPRKTWTVEGFLGDGELVCPFGSPSAGKSVLVGDKNGHVAAGRQWFGRRMDGSARRPRGARLPGADAAPLELVRNQVVLSD